MSALSVDGLTRRFGSLVAVDNPHPPSRYLSRIYVDSLVHDARALRLVLDTFGPARVALGSDYPFPLGEELPGALIDTLDLPSPARDRLRAGTALEWLGKSASDHDL
jgi:aminocarboxymuconate-semialdehyde decarboxylase